jgi:prepilin-type N-terminal cleavage/methylation domain-containing protein
MKRRGFTLVEVIITATIVAVVAAAIASLFSSGVNLWNRAKQASVYQDSVVLDLEGVCRQLRQVVSSRRVAFRGTGSAVTFMVAGDDGLSECRYEFDPLRKALLHKERTLAQVIDDKQSMLEMRPVIQEVSTLVFSYGSIDAKSREWKWESSWASEKSIPLALRIKVTKNGQSLEKTVFIPAAAKEKTAVVIGEQEE